MMIHMFYVCLGSVGVGIDGGLSNGGGGGTPSIGQCMHAWRVGSTEQSRSRTLDFTRLLGTWVISSHL